MKKVENCPKKLYVCQTYFHLLIAIIKSIKDVKSDNYLLLTSSGWTNDNLIYDSNLKTKLEDSSIFTKVMIDDFELDFRKTIQNSKIKWIKKYIFLQKMKKNFPINFSDYDELYLFSDTVSVGIFLNKMKIYYNLIEDGTDCFKNNKRIIVKKWNLKKAIKYIFGIRDMGTSKYIKSVEVNDAKGVFLKKKLVEVPRNMLFASLTEKEAQKIAGIFLNDVNLLDFKNYSLLITQPLLRSELLRTNQEQLDIYDMVIEQYLKNEKVLIKTHPRDSVDYSKLNHECKILKENFPLEIFNFFEKLEFKKAVTISSTSINILTNVKKKIILGWDWLDEAKKELKKNESRKEK